MFKKWLPGTLTAIATLAGISSAQAQTSLFIAGGLNAPVGQLGDATDLGYVVAGGLNFGGTLAPIGVRLEGTFSDLGYQRGGGDIRLVSGTANAIFNLGNTRDAPYIIAGLGAYNRSAGSGTFGYDGRTALGINGGAGLRFPLSGLSTFFEARYHIMLGNEAEGTNYQFIPIVFGISF